MRIEFMAPEEFKREKDFRVDVEKGVHARSCTGGSIALAESSFHPISGKLPDGSPFSASVRVTKPHALVMLKLLALDDRYRNIRGSEQAKHDREEAPDTRIRHRSRHFRAGRSRGVPQEF